MIRVALIAVIAGLLGLFIQSTFIHSAFPAAIAPDFILVLVVLLALRERNVAYVCLAFFLGILADLASGQFLGLNSAGAVVAFLLVGVISTRVYAERPLAIAFITFVCSLAKSAVCVLLLLTYVSSSVLTNDLWRIVLIEALLSAIAAPLLLYIFNFGARTSRSKGSRSKSTSYWASSV